MVSTDPDLAARVWVSIVTRSSPQTRKASAVAEPVAARDFEARSPGSAMLEILGAWREKEDVPRAGLLCDRRCS
jgi:hypothetical protein